MYRITKVPVSITGHAIMLVHDERSSKFMPIASVQLPIPLIDHIIRLNEKENGTREFQLEIQYLDSKVTVKKNLKTMAEAVFWAHLCLDICGKDERGNRYITAQLTENGERILL